MKKLYSLTLLVAVLALLGISSEAQAAAPSVQARNLGISSVTPNSLNLNWISGNGFYRVVVATQGTAIDLTNFGSGTGVLTANLMNTGANAFGDGYSVGSNSFVVYQGNGNSVSITGLQANTTYTFAVLEYNAASMTTSDVNLLSANNNPRTYTMPINLQPPTPGETTDISADGATIHWSVASGQKPDGFLIDVYYDDEDSDDGAEGDMESPVMYPYYDSYDIVPDNADNTPPYTGYSFDLDFLYDETDHYWAGRSYWDNRVTEYGADSDVFTTSTDDDGPAAVFSTESEGCSNADELTVMVDFGEPVRYFDITDIDITNDGTGILYEAGAWNLVVLDELAGEYELTITGIEDEDVDMSGELYVSLTLSHDVVDYSDNAAFVAESTDVAFDFSAPSIDTAMFDAGECLSAANDDSVLVYFELSDNGCGNENMSYTLSLVDSSTSEVILSASELNGDEGVEVADTLYISDIPVEAGTYSIVLTVNDGVGNSTTDTLGSFSIDNLQPEIIAEDYIPTLETCFQDGELIDFELTITEAGCGGIDAENVLVYVMGESADTLNILDNSIEVNPGENPDEYIVTGSYTIDAAALGLSGMAGSATFWYDMVDGAGNEPVVAPFEGSSFIIDDSLAQILSQSMLEGACVSGEMAETLSVYLEIDDQGCSADNGMWSVSFTQTIDTTTVEVSAEYYDSLSTGYYSIDLDSLATGDYSFDITYTDGFGNETTGSNSFSVDHSAPELFDATILGGDGCYSPNDTLRFTLNGISDMGCAAFDAGDTNYVQFWVALDSTANGPVNMATFDAGIWYVPLDGATSGSYTFYAKLVDSLGNANWNPADTNDYGDLIGTISVDGEGPVVTFDLESGDPASSCYSNISDYTFVVKAYDAGCSGLDIDDIQVGGLLAYPEFDGMGWDIDSISDLGFLTMDGYTGTGTEGDPYVITYTYNVLSGNDGTFFTPYYVAEDMDGNEALCSTSVADHYEPEIESEVSIDACLFNIEGPADEIVFFDNTDPAPMNFEMDEEGQTCFSYANDDNLDFYFEVAEMSPCELSDIVITTNPPLEDGVSIENVEWVEPGVIGVWGEFDLDSDDASDSYDVQIIATDGAGNESAPYIYEDAFSIDNLEPNVNIDEITPVQSCFVSGDTVTVTVAVTDAGCGNDDFGTDNIDAYVRFSNDSSAALSFVTEAFDVYTYRYVVTGTEPSGDVDVVIEAEDGVGNWEADEAEGVFDIITGTLSTTFDVVTNNDVDAPDADRYARDGHMVTATITSNRNLDWSVAEINGNDVLGTMNTTGSYEYTFTWTVTGGLNAVSTFNFEAEDCSGNEVIYDESNLEFDITFDNTAPACTLNYAGTEPTSANPVLFTTTLTEAVYGFGDEDYTVGGTAGATEATHTENTPTLYDGQVTGMNADGNITIDIADSLFTDIAGNPNTGALMALDIDWLLPGRSEVIDNIGSEDATISSVTDTEGEATGVNFTFRISDDENDDAVDALPMMVSGMTVNKAAGDDFGDWAEVIGGAVLSDGTNSVTATSITDSTIVFTGISNASPGDLGYTADNADHGYTVSIWLRSDISDSLGQIIEGMNFEFEIENDDISVETTSSRFEVPSSYGGVASAEGANEVEVTATDLAFGETINDPTTLNTNTTFNIWSTDENGNVDHDYSGPAVTLTPLSYSGSMTLQSSVTWTNGLFTRTVRFNTFSCDLDIQGSNGDLNDDVYEGLIITPGTPSQPSVFNASLDKTTTTLTWNVPTPGAKTLIIGKQSSVVIAYPNESALDGDGDGLPLLTPSTAWGSAPSVPGDTSIKLLHMGLGTSATITGLTPNTWYSFAAYAYRAENCGVDSLYNFNETERTRLRKTNARTGVEGTDFVNYDGAFGIGTLYPNPARDEVNFLLDIADATSPITIEIFGVTGELVAMPYNNQTFGEGAHNIKIAIPTEMASGQYMLKVSSGNHFVIGVISVAK